MTASSSGRLFDQTVTFTTLLMETFTFKCSNAEDIRDVVDFFLKGLKDRSQYAVATGAYKPLGGGSGLRRGDLVRLAYDQTGASLLKTGWCVGTNERSEMEYLDSSLGTLSARLVYDFHHFLDDIVFTFNGR